MLRFRKILMATACLGAVALTSCGHNDDDNIINSFAAYSFSIDIEETGANQDLVLTTIQYIDYKGNKVKSVVTPDEDGIYHFTSHSYTTVPYGQNIEVIQELSGDNISYDQSNYSFGLSIDAEIKSVDVSGGTINRTTANNERKFNCTASKLSSNFPRITYIKYYVNKYGEVSISITQ